MGADPIHAVALTERLKNLDKASKALYMAGRWTLSEDLLGAEEQAALWEDLRSALGFDPGYSTSRSSSIGRAPAL